MPWFIKTETFTPETAALPIEQRRPHLNAHRQWLLSHGNSGRRIHSGYLVDAEQRPGGGGLLIFEASSFEDAHRWVQADPMIQSGLVTWQLQEWIQIGGDEL
ncbi:YCII-like domain protein [Synechococcus sp. BIOS-U3-1]|uniref:YciI family protein n=1 Tax=Synechococcus sp. BIOS-U3-1 TaxID=1400865 RepID=UPI001645C1D0|nr:YciI family protein [Synechococcus sp. BIOS-U3-1]QNI57362.1 YCII-like domain protein [Synechococcus sp. BIOS-U3-1]|tara:strand:- start:871 stop:1176 length:306 start_codon:yes stop_codon:yes gene_type:complete